MPRNLIKSDLALKLALRTRKPEDPHARISDGEVLWDTHQRGCRAMG